MVYKNINQSTSIYTTKPILYHKAYSFFIVFRNINIAGYQFLQCNNHIFLINIFVIIKYIALYIYCICV